MLVQASATIRATSKFLVHMNVARGVPSMPPLHAKRPKRLVVRATATVSPAR